MSNCVIIDPSKTRMLGGAGTCNGIKPNKAVDVRIHVYLCCDKIQ